MYNFWRIFRWPIIKFKYYKLIGVYKGGIEENKINLGTLIKAPIEEFYNNIKIEKKDIEKNKNENEKYYDSKEKKRR